MRVQRTLLFAATWGLGAAMGTDCSDWGDDCSQTQCCKHAGAACYRKHDWYSACLMECDTSTTVDGETWDCTQLGKSPSSKNQSKPSKHSKHTKTSQAKTPTTTTSIESPDPAPSSEPTAEPTLGPTTSAPEPTQSTTPTPELTLEPTDTTEGMDVESVNIKGVDANTLIMKQTSSVSNASHAQDCAPCTPRERSVPDVVIPIWEHNLCKVAYTVKSIAVHDPNQVLGTVLLMWVSQQSSSNYQVAIDQIQESLSGTHNAKVLDLSSQMNDEQVDAWVAQQVFQLKVATLVESDFYVVLDAKNALVRDLEPEAFFTKCNQGKIYGEFEPDKIPQPYADWYEASAEALGVKPPGVADSIDARLPTSIKPMVLHRRTVLDLLDSIGEERSVDRMCSGSLCETLGAHSAGGRGATEFTLFVLFARMQPDITCSMAVEDTSERRPLALSLWRSSEDAQQEANLQTCRKVASGKARPYMFGSQTAALEHMSDEMRQQAQELMANIYATAKLHNKSRTSSDALVRCVAGDVEGTAGPIEDVEGGSLETTEMHTESDEVVWDSEDGHAGEVGQDGEKDEAGFCCSDAQDSDDMCGTCWDGAQLSADTYCGSSKEHCVRCQGVWCSMSSDQVGEGSLGTQQDAEEQRRSVKVSCEESGCENYDVNGCECNDRCEQDCDADLITIRMAMDKKFSEHRLIQEASRAPAWTSAALPASLLCMVTMLVLAFALRSRSRSQGNRTHQVLVLEDTSCSEA